MIHKPVDISRHGKLKVEMWASGEKSEESPQSVANKNNDSITQLIYWKSIWSKKREQLGNQTYLFPVDMYDVTTGKHLTAVRRSFIAQARRAKLKRRERKHNLRRRNCIKRKLNYKHTVRWL